MTEDGGLKGKWGYELGPSDIETESFRIISTLVDLTRYTPQEVALVSRIVHATGDPALAPSIMFTPGALKAGSEAIKAGAPIITDVEMVRAGVSSVRAKSFGSKVECFLNHPEVMAEAKARGQTRSVVAVEKAVHENPGAVFAFGNAPTALFRLLDLVSEGKARPALIIGVVVGFVGAAESKDALMARTDLEWISVKGYRGGSNIAAASVNALMKIAAGEF